MSKTPVTLDHLLNSNGMLRGLAIWLVVFAHLKSVSPFCASLEFIPSMGKLGVAIFVFYAGLLHQHNSLSKGQRWHPSPWIRKRIMSLYPAYWLGLLLTLVVSAPRHLTFSSRTIAANITGIPMFMGMPVLGGSYIKPFWFISLIVLCYGLFLVLHRFPHKSLLVIMSGLVSMALTVLWHQHGLDNPEWLLVLLALPMFFSGMATADYLYRRKSIGGHPLAYLIVVCVGLVVTSMLFRARAQSAEEQRYVFSMIGLCTLNLSAVYLCVFLPKYYSGIQCKFPRTIAHLEWTGKLSFLIYCMHEPFFLILEVLTPALGSIGALFIYGTALFTFSSLLHRSGTLLGHWLCKNHLHAPQTYVQEVLVA